MCRRRFDCVVAFAFVCVGLGASGCASSRPALGPEAVVQSIIHADNAGDLEAVMDCYTDDVVWISPQGDLITGRSAIRDRYATMYRDYDARLSATIEEIETSDKLAIVRGVTEGRLSPKDGGDDVSVSDKFLAVLRREQGRWRVSQLMWSPMN